MENVIYKSIDFENRKLKFYNHCKKWSAKLPYVSPEMEYDLVSNKFEYAFMELFNYQLNADDVFLLIQTGMEDIFKNAKSIRDSKRQKIKAVACDDSRKFLNRETKKYFDILFREFKDVKSIKIPFIDDIRFEILSYVA